MVPTGYSALRDGASRGRGWSGVPLAVLMAVVSACSIVVSVGFMSYMPWRTGPDPLASPLADMNLRGISGKLVRLCGLNKI